VEKRDFPTECRAKVCENPVLPGLFKELATDGRKPVFEADDFAHNLRPHTEKLREGFRRYKQKSFRGGVLQNADGLLQISRLPAFQTHITGDPHERTTGAPSTWTINAPAGQVKSR
jgi:hypothetical protein